MMTDCNAETRDSDGRWMDTGSLKQSASDSLKLSNHVKGELAGALQWGRVWVPRSCSYFRYTGATFLSAACPRVNRLSLRDNKSKPFWHLLILGDSGGGRGVYCHLYALFMHGTEKQPPFLDYGNPDEVGCGGIFPVSMKNSSKVTYRHKENDDGPSLNASHYLRWSASGESGGRLFHFDITTPLGTFRISWTYVYGLRPENNVTAIVDVFKRIEDWPDDIVIGTGSFDYDHLSRTARTVPDLDAFSEVGYQRMNGAQMVLESIPATSKAHVWYRNNHCNSRFPAKAADEFVSDVFRKAGHRVLETFNFSVGFYHDMSHDGFHYDRYPWVEAAIWENHHPHVGELNAQVAQSLLYNLCAVDNEKVSI
jgi:hypothetical protein